MQTFSTNYPLFADAVDEQATPARQGGVTTSLNLMLATQDNAKERTIKFAMQTKLLRSKDFTALLLEVNVL